MTSIVMPLLSLRRTPKRDPSGRRYQRPRYPAGDGTICEPGVRASSRLLNSGEVTVRVVSSVLLCRIPRCCPPGRKISSIGPRTGSRTPQLPQAGSGLQRRRFIGQNLPLDAFIDARPRPPVRIVLLDLPHQGAGTGGRDVEAHFLRRGRFMNPPANDAGSSTLARARGDKPDPCLTRSAAALTRPLPAIRVSRRNARLARIEALERNGEAQAPQFQLRKEEGMAGSQPFPAFRGRKQHKTLSRSKICIHT